MPKQIVYDFQYFIDQKNYKAKFTLKYFIDIKKLGGDRTLEKFKSDIEPFIYLINDTPLFREDIFLIHRCAHKSTVEVFDYVLKDLKAQYDIYIEDINKILSIKQGDNSIKLNLFKDHVFLNSLIETSILIDESGTVDQQNTNKEDKKRKTEEDSATLEEKFSKTENDDISIYEDDFVTIESIFPQITDLLQKDCETTLYTHHYIDLTGDDTNLYNDIDGYLDT